MRKAVATTVAVLVLVLGAASAGTARGGTGPSNVCYGQIVAGIASTWPWAHEDKVAFAPPPGAIALWLQIFGPQVGVSSVRDLQLLFCNG
jgi:hypothetical protein